MNFPRLTIYSSDLVEMCAAGTTYGPVSFIAHQFRDDESVHRHEWEHVNQWWVVLLLFVVFGLLGGGLVFICLAPFAHGLAYNAIRRYRLYCERDAYRVQMRYPDARGGLLSIEAAASCLMHPTYGFCLTHDQAIQLLK